MCRTSTLWSVGSLENAHFEWACFQSQQAGEKALKAVWYFHEEAEEAIKTAQAIVACATDLTRADPSA